MASSLVKASIAYSDTFCPSRSTRSRPGERDRPLASKVSRLSISFKREGVSMAAGRDDASISTSSDARQGFSVPDVSSSKVTIPPRMCSLREFGEGAVAVGSDTKVSSFFESLAANIEFAYKVQDWEILSGRLAMMVFATAVLVEAITGNSVFEKMDSQRLLEISGAIFVSIVVAAGFAVALQAKTKVAYSVSKGYESMMNALIDGVFNSLLFDREDP